MKNRPYYFEIKNLITQFMSAFNDIAIKRYTEERHEVGDTVAVGFLYSPRSRVIEDILNKSRAIALPAISISISSIARDAERVFNKIDGHNIHINPIDQVRKIPQPVPINVSINMSIIARYQADIEQIISNFVPYCDPYITVSWKLPTTENTAYEKELRTIIEWGGTLNMQYPVELTNSQVARVVCDTTFTIKGWLFKQIDTTYKKIFNITTTFSPTPLGEGCFVFNNNSDVAELYQVSPEVESYIHLARPVIKSINYNNYYIGTTDETFEYNLYGQNFSNITNIFLQTSTPNIFQNASYIEPFAYTYLSAAYTGFSGISVSNFTVNSLNNITFTIPQEILQQGRFDIIVVNDAGYGILSKDSIIPTPASGVTIHQPASVNGMYAVQL